MRAFAADGKVSPRQDEGIHLRPKSRLTAVGLRNAPAGAAPYGCFAGWQLITKQSVGNGLDRSGN